MRKFIMSLTTVASLSLAAIPVLGLTQAANAADLTVRVAYGDLNLATPAHAKIFKARVEAASETFCRQQLDTGNLSTTMRGCVAAVRRQVDMQLPAAQHQALAMAAQSKATEFAAK